MERTVAAALVITVAICLGLDQAYEGERSDFDGTSYPRHQCKQPVPSYSTDPFDRRLFTHNLEQYRFCIRTYARAAGNADEPARQRANEAIAEFNAFVRDLNEGL